MVNRPESADAARQSLSALMDGEVDPSDVAGVCRSWRDDSSARECWHTYHLIGDVLRSDELAGEPGRDAAFLRVLSQRLAAEPVPLAPAPAQQVAVRRSRRWLLAPVAASAGLAAVVGFFLVARAPAPDEASRTIAVGKPPPEMVVVNGQLIRDAKLDRYLAAHRKVADGTVSVPGGVMRSVDTIVLEGK